MPRGIFLPPALSAAGRRWTHARGNILGRRRVFSIKRWSMYCDRCGSLISPASRFCGTCGKAIQPGSDPAGRPAVATAPAAPPQSSYAYQGRVERHVRALAILWCINGILRLLEVGSFYAIGREFLPWFGRAFPSFGFPWAFHNGNSESHQLPSPTESYRGHFPSLRVLRRQKANSTPIS